MKVEKIKVHIADDHKILIDGIIALINTEDDIEVEGFSQTGREVIEWSKKNSTDILILDINMPIADGIEVLRFFQMRNIEQKTIILSSLSDVKIVREMLALGALGFIDKSCAGEHIIKAIRTVNNGAKYFNDEIRDDLFVSFTDKPDKEEEEEEELSYRELEVLKMLLKEMTNLDISEELNVSENTVKTYKRRIHKKLKTKTTVGLVKYAIKNGII